tara:strand:- start:1631 stop:2101 length:471 start_codon:yes stop_codon:yes gene_type:complete
MKSVEIKKIHVKPAILKDAEFIWSIRNHKKSLIWFGERIKLSDHLLWFKNEFKIERSFFYIANLEKNKVGYLRFSMAEKKFPVISYGIKEEFKKNGYGSILLKEASAKFFKSNKNIFKVIAWVHKKNIASLKSFERAGFKYTKKDYKYFYFELCRN